MDYIIFALRLLLGGLLLFAGILKAHDGPAATAAAVAGYRILPAMLVAPLGVALPYFEILLGAYLVGGLFTRIAAYVSAAQFALFSVAVSSLVIRQIPADCGCFGSAIATPPSWGHVAFDLLLTALAFWIGWFAPGALALDRSLGLVPRSGGRVAAGTEE